MEYLILWVILGGVVAVIANGKGFDTAGWFFYGALLFPIALAHVIVKPANLAPVFRRPDNSFERETKTCPECAEAIKREAKVCRFCGNRQFPVSLEKEETEFTYPDYRPARPKPTAWQRLWWNQHPEPRKRR